MDQMNETARVVFDAASEQAYKGHEQEWDAVMQLVGLPLNYQPAVAVALEQGRWRGAQAPIRYVKTVAKREARNLDLVEGHWSDATEAPLVGDLVEGAGELRGGEFEDATENFAFHQDDNYGPYDNYFDSRLATKFLMDDCPDVSNDIDWDQIADLGGCDDDEREVLIRRMSGATREGLLQHAATDQERRRLDSAWRRLTRKFPKIRESLAGEKTKEEEAFG